MRWFVKVIDIGVAKLHVLHYHRVLEKPDPLKPYEMHAARFDALLRWLSKRFQILPLDRAYQQLLEGTLPKAAISLTFDDGYQDNLEVALPILQKHNVSASVFIATGFCNQQLMFNDIVYERVRRHDRDFQWNGTRFDGTTLLGKRQIIDTLIGALKPLSLEQRTKQLAKLFPDRQPLPKLMLDPDGVQALAKAGIHIGAHTVDHPILSALNPSDALHQIKHSKLWLENLLQKPITWFAYPNGKRHQDFHAKHEQMVKDCGYLAALTTESGIITKQSARFALPRYTPWHRQKSRFIAQMYHHRLRAKHVA